MVRNLLPWKSAFWFVIAASTVLGSEEQPPRAEAASPDGQLRVELSIAGSGEEAGCPTYRVLFRGRPVILPSRLGLVVVVGPGFGLDSVIEGFRKRAIDEKYAQHPGKRSRVVNRCEEVTVSFRERSAPARRWEIIVRAYNDGVALRYRFAAPEGWEGPRDRQRTDPVPPA